MHKGIKPARPLGVHITEAVTASASALQVLKSRRVLTRKELIRKRQAAGGPIAFTGGFKPPEVTRRPRAVSAVSNARVRTSWVDVGSTPKPVKHRIRSLEDRASQQMREFISLQAVRGKKI